MKNIATFLLICLSMLTLSCSSTKNASVDKNDLDNELTEMINPQEQYNLLLHIRRWNSKHPEKQLRVGFSDIEHDYKTTIKNIIIPYFNKIEVDTSTDIDNLTDIDLGKLLPDYRKKLEIAKEKNLIDPLPVGPVTKKTPCGAETTCMIWR